MSGVNSIDYEAMDSEELNEHLQAISNQRDALREHALGIRAVRDRKAAAEAAKAKLAVLNDDEKAALIQELKIASIQGGGSAGNG